jgi:hypothetical protein
MKWILSDSVADPDPHSKYFVKLDSDPHPHQSEKQNPDPHQSENQVPDPQHCIKNIII